MKSIFAIMAVLLTLVGRAYAADLYVPEQPVEAPPVAVQTGGWYLRGDVSYDFLHMRGANYFCDDCGGRHDYKSPDLQNTGNLGVGVGYQVSDMLRVDTTFDYMFNSKFHGETICDTCAKDSSSLTAYSLMANAYVDLAHYGMFTPYLGVGIGGTHVKWGDVSHTCDPCGVTEMHDGKSGWRFTYALMAGTAVDISCNLKADVGYRYRHVVGGAMADYSGNGPAMDKGLDIHEARAGLRYSFENGDCAPAYVAPADIPQQPQPVFK